MSPRAGRIAFHAAVALVATAAVAFTPRLPKRAPAVPALAAVVARPVTPAPVFVRRVDTLGRGESLAALLGRHGFGATEAAAALRAAPSLDMRRVPAGAAVAVERPDPTAAPTAVELRLLGGRVLRLTRGADGGWAGAEERPTWTTDTAVVAGVVRSTLYQAFDDGAAALPARERAELAWSLADILEYRVDMERDLQRGDSVRVLFERETSSAGQVRVGRILAGRMTAGGEAVELVRYEGRHGAEYYDAQGKTLREAYLRTPLQFRRVSSNYGRRRHPILGVWKQHRGTDYSAASGTPVRAIGDGVVLRAGWNRGYGNLLEVRLRNGFVTRYGHLRGFASGVRAGARVGVGQTVGYVGSTGLSTAPHLHFEMLVGGAHRDPRVALRQLKGGSPIAAGERAAFERARDRMRAALVGGTAATLVATADAAPRQ